ncbi:ATP-binding protein [Caulobacter sp. NIBR1757]|uniref:hybrid sensor histidine kinase/response regulator n=1 Tax=Caulobacter sp. NIBR1757 TaxID=3016000 RepID=UPI0022F08B96|nr:ATP-binding protein [Caulobacter sp. NIBR1757]WGM38050.1 Sensor histidine kinase RcsC [Caulobacter sp. NIBR1757]
MRAIVCGIVALLLAAGTPVLARQAMTPAQLASAIEGRAVSSSFADLRRFGDTALLGKDREALRRLNYVATVFRNQSEFELFNRYNDAMADQARVLGDDRYLTIADLNRVAGRMSQGDPSAVADLQSRQTASDDWYVRAHAQTLWATVLINRQQTGAALKLLYEAELLIDQKDSDAKAAESEIWETIGIALMGLNDLDGSARAFQRSQFEFADAGWPRPDFDAVYNLGDLAIRLGDEVQARKLVAVHHELTVKSGLENLRAWDAYLCGMYAEAFAGPAQVLQCTGGLSQPIEDTGLLAPRLLPMRAIASARTGKATTAARDLETLRALEASKRFDQAAFKRLPQIEAELLLARGDGAAAFELFRKYERDQRFQTSQDIYGGVRQITGSLETQLTSARKQTELTKAAVRAQGWVIALGVLLTLGATIAALLLFRGGRRLKAARSQADAASTAKSAFLATMSHEIRTPLNGVLGMAQAMASDDLDSVQRERLGIIQQSGEALLVILNDVLDLSKIEAGKLEIEQLPFQLSSVAGAAYSAFADLARRKGVTLTMELGPAAGCYLGDPTRVRQILYNLVSNAVKFTEDGQVRIEAGYDDGRLEIRVTDTGVGISQENLGKLFGKFDQLDSSTTRRFGGTGLGLSICHELAQLMGGEIAVTSFTGVGSTFTLRLPIERLGDEDSTTEEATGDADAAPFTLRVLAAEDNKVNQIVLTTLLAQVGISPTIVDDGQAAVDAWEGAEWDVILMDVQMPVLDGVAATRAIREAEGLTGRRRTPIIALTANAMAHHVSQYLAAGMDTHVSKPIQAMALYEALAWAADGIESEASGEASAA